MEKFIIILMLCGIKPNGQEFCSPKTLDPIRVYDTRESCLRAGNGALWSMKRGSSYVVCVKYEG